MKKIIIIAAIFCASLSCKSQIIPIEGIQEYLSDNNISSVPEGAYLKDVNGLFDGFIGEWQATYNGRVYTFYIAKETIFRERTLITRDKLYMKYLITELDGTVVLDTQEEEGNSVFGDKFTDNLEFFIFGFGGEKSKCGSRGDIYIKHAASSNPITPQIQIGLLYRGGVVGVNEALCGDFVLEESPLYPLSLDLLTLTRQ